MAQKFLSPHGSSKTLSPMVERACRHWEARGRAAAAKQDLSPHSSHALTVTISREAGTSGTQVAQEVGKRLQWHVYDQDLLERIAEEMGVRAALLETVDERQQSWLMESIASFLSMPGKSAGELVVSESAFVRHLVETVLALGVHGQCIIVGRAASFILAPETTLRVRLVAPLQTRVAAMQSSFKLSAKEAAGRVRSIDRQRIEFVKDHFFKDPTDPRGYDIVLNAQQFSLAQRAEVIGLALEQLQKTHLSKGNGAAPA